MATRVVNSKREADLAEAQGFNVPAHSDEDYPLTVKGKRDE